MNGTLLVLAVLILAVVGAWQQQAARWDAERTMEEWLRVETRKGQRLLRVDAALGIKHSRPLERKGAA